MRALGEIGDEDAHAAIQEIRDSINETKLVSKAAEWASERMRGTRVREYSSYGYRD